jgi:hypothetical protein
MALPLLNLSIFIELVCYTCSTVVLQGLSLLIIRRGLLLPNLSTVSVNGMESLEIHLHIPNCFSRCFIFRFIPV